MTNYEHYGKEIIRVLKTDNNFGLDREKDEIMPCDSMHCENCMFFTELGNCHSPKGFWLEMEHKEPIVLNKLAKDYLNYSLSSGYNWLAISGFKDFTLFTKKPIREEESPYWDREKGDLLPSAIQDTFILNSLRTLSKGELELYNIEELLKEVEE